MRATIVLLLICISMLEIQTQQDTEGGIPMLEWHKKCNDHFKNYPQANEKEFLIAGYCESYVCEKFTSGQIGMRVDGCSGKAVNGKRCIQKPIKSLPYPKCCRLKCFDK